MYICSVIIKTKEIMTQLQDLYLTLEEFEKYLDECSAIMKYPSKRKPYYVCEHLSAGLHKRKVNVYVNK